MRFARKRGNQHLPGGSFTPIFADTVQLDLFTRCFETQRLHNSLHGCLLVVLVLVIDPAQTKFEHDYDDEFEDDKNGVFPSPENNSPTN
jgi:hypothetical protein